ncbi:MAG TPA: serine/threonine-protein kinase [Phycisphaerae bacterium]|nr:serine/threonine-protein kinase [Phycisphaerae bacterium]
MQAPQVGDRISEYVLDQLVGAGSFGQVWKAHHHVWKDNFVAIKVPTDSQYVRNLQKEGTVIHGLQHANIVRALGLDPYSDAPYLVMEYIDGCSLRDLINAHPKGMPIQSAQNIICGMLGALEHSHASGVIHRDIKPANILIAQGNRKDPEQIGVADVKVTDFGLGHVGQVTTQSIMQSGSLVAEDGKSISGTLAYMSPEQRDGQSIDGRSDLYSVGIVLFEMMTGERPSGSDMPSDIRSGLPTWVDKVYTRMYTRRDRRFPTAGDAMREIQTCSVPPVARGGAFKPEREVLVDFPPAIRPPYYGPENYASAGPAHVARHGSTRCPSCNTPVDSSDNYCIMCGTQVVPNPRRCAHCAAYPGLDDKYCVFCGTPLPDMVG